MKATGRLSEKRWEDLVAQARADVGPSVDVPELLRAVRGAAREARTSWAAEFSALFSAGRVVQTCMAGAVAIAALTTWQVWEWWQALPWAQWLVPPGGGA